MYNTILTLDLEQIMNKNKVTILDIRETDEWLNGHIKGAIHLPMSTLASNLDKLNKEEMYYVICHSGNRSTQVAKVLSKMNYKITNVMGGMSLYKGDLSYEV